MAATPQVFTNAVKATALTNAQAALPGTWVQRENWDGVGLSVGSSTGSGGGYTAGLGCPGERWVLGGNAGRIDLILTSGGTWQALLYPGS